MSVLMETLNRRWRVQGSHGPAGYCPSWVQPAENPGLRYEPETSPLPVPRGRTLCGVRVPPGLEGLAQIVERSRWMLDLQPDWDGQGSPSYSEETWEAAAVLLISGAVEYAARFGKRIPDPAFENGPDGSIDILWETGGRSLLLNVPAETSAPVQYYGRDDHGSEVKGTVFLSDRRTWFPLVVQWLLQ